MQRNWHPRDQKAVHTAAVKAFRERRTTGELPSMGDLTYRSFTGKEKSLPGVRFGSETDGRVYDPDDRIIAKVSD